MSSEAGAVSGRTVVVVLLAMIASAAGGLVWYKHQPQQLPPALNTETGVMLLIPAGPFLYGPDKSEGVAPAFYIDRIEVTNAAWMRFASATQRPFTAGRPNDPVVDITIEDAAAFAKWAGKRLPDALEWEKAYRGSNGRTYPWGDAADRSRANVSDNPGAPGHIVSADSMPEGGSPYNLLHMAGNAGEYTRTVVSGSDSQLHYAVKGGSFDRPLSGALPWQSVAAPATFRAANTGFRCVKDPPRR